MCPRLYNNTRMTLQLYNIFTLSFRYTHVKGQCRVVSSKFNTRVGWDPD